MRPLTRSSKSSSLRIGVSVPSRCGCATAMGVSCRVPKVYTLRPPRSSASSAHDHDLGVRAEVVGDADDVDALDAVSAGALGRAGRGDRAHQLILGLRAHTLHAAGALDARELEL